jgi:hypothetical protein
VISEPDLQRLRLRLREAIADVERPRIAKAKRLAARASRDAKRLARIAEISRVCRELASATGRVPSYRQIGLTVGLTGERVRQIITASPELAAERAALKSKSL